MNAVLFLILIILTGLFSKFAYGIGADRELNTALITAKQITTPSNPSSGFSRIYVKSDGKAYILDSAGSEKPLGSGVGGSRFQLLEDSSFEDGVSEGTCSGCTATSEGTIILAAPNNAASLKMAFSAATGSYTIDKNTSAEYNATNAVTGCWIKTSASGVKFHARVNGANVLEKDVSSSDTWEFYDIPFVAGTTSIGYQVEASSSITDDIYVDECTLGASEVVTSEPVLTEWVDAGAITIGATTTPPTKGTVTQDKVLWRRVGDSMEIEYRYSQTSAGGAAGSGTYLFEIPNGLSIDTSKVAASTTITTDSMNDVSSMVGKGSIVQSLGVGGSFGVFVYNENNLYFKGDVLADLTVASSTSGSSGNSMSSASAITFALNMGFRAKVTVPIQGWSASESIVAQANDIETTAKFLTADVTTSTTVSDLEFTGLEIGREYELSFQANLDSAGSGGLAQIVAIHDSNTILKAFALGSSARVVTSYSNTVKFTATATTVTFQSTVASGGLILGDGTQAETFAQLRPLSKLIIGQFKDVVTSPGSSNGKPVLCSADISSTGVISNQSGGCFSSCTNATRPVCTFTADYWAATPKCWGECTSNGFEFFSTQTATTFEKPCVNSSGTDVTGNRRYFCQGDKK